jgi:hypothetical protein
MNGWEYRIMNWIQSYEGIYTLIIIHAICWIGYMVKDGIINKEHLK